MLANLRSMITVHRRASFAVAGAEELAVQAIETDDVAALFRGFCCENYFRAQEGCYRL